MKASDSALRLDSHRAVAAKATELRRSIVDMIYAARSGHPGGALGMADVLATLYYRFFNDRPQEPDWPDRDRFVLSAGHICPILYAILAARSYFPAELLATFRRLGSPVQGHPSIRSGLPGVDYSGGSLGNGLSFALGTALAARITGRPYQTYCVVSDGECQEGQTWEAAMAAAHYKAGNLIAFVDHNGMQIDGPMDTVMEVRPLAPRWQAFGWHVQEVDGHDAAAIYAAIAAALAETERPSMIIANTVIGKGISYMEGDFHWHHGVPTAEQYAQAMAELKD